MWEAGTTRPWSPSGCLDSTTQRNSRGLCPHPTISDGITGQEAKIVATFRGWLDPNLLDKLLDPAQVTLEERTISLPLGAETELTIIRTRPGTGLAMDLLEHSVLSIEEFMGLPFPRQQVIYLFHEGSSSEGPAASNFNTHVSVLRDEQSLSEESMLFTLAHEAGHYYWRGLTRWMSEGAATFLGSMAKDALPGPLDNPPCIPAQTIAELEDLARDPAASGNALPCHYSLGERLFRDLYRNMDDTTFRLAFRSLFRRLYQHTVFDEPGDECRTASSYICHVEAAFTTDVSESMLAAVEKVIARWYDGTEPHDLSSIDGTPIEADIAAIDGRIDAAYLSLSRGGLPVSTVTVGPNRNPVIFLNLDYSYRNSGGLGSLPIETALYYEDGFEFQRRREELPVPANVVRQTHHIPIPHERVPGRYWVHVLLGQQKIAEVTFQAVPEGDPHSIRGVVTGPDGQPPGRVALWIKRGEETFWSEAGQDGAFDAEVSSGSFILEVHLLVGSEWRFVGWYDGSGGMTTDPSQASQVIVADANIDDIDIRLPTQIDGLLCPAGTHRSPLTGRCP